MEEMHISTYLVEYALNGLCKGNQSEFARKMDSSKDAVRQMFKRLNKGSISILTAEAVLQMFLREGYSIDEALLGYDVARSANRKQASWRCFSGALYLVELRKKMDELHGAKSNTICSYELVLRVYLLMRQVESQYCIKEQKDGFPCPLSYKGQGSIYVAGDLCPCKSLNEYYVRLMALPELQ